MENLWSLFWKIQGSAAAEGGRLEQRVRTRGGNKKTERCMLLLAEDEEVTPDELPKHAEQRSGDEDGVNPAWPWVKT